MNLSLNSWRFWKSANITFQNCQVRCFIRFCLPTTSQSIAAAYTMECCKKERNENEYEMLRMLNSACRQCYKNNLPTAVDMLERKTLRENLIFQLNSGVLPVRLYPFGSSVNGFGFRNSDVDVYVVGITLKKVYAILKSLPEYTNLVWIRCRIPLIKFKHVLSNVEVDITVANGVALRNSKLLLRYSQVNQRCKVLVSCLKHLAKICNFTNTKTHFISSYAFTIMAIYYLQQVDPPVLPVLQELFDNDSEDPFMVDGFDTSFYSKSNHQLQNDWPEYGKNKESVAELFVGLLHFYGHKFKYDENVVSIKQKKVMSRGEWKVPGSTEKPFILEDPFEVKRNLGGQLTVVRSAMFKDFFVQAHKHFSTLPAKTLQSSDILDYYFNPSVLLKQNTQKYMKDCMSTSNGMFFKKHKK